MIMLEKENSIRRKRERKKERGDVMHEQRARVWVLVMLRNPSNIRMKITIKLF